MRISRFLRVMLLALLVCLIPASSSAAVLISVGFAPPPLPVYVQPPCPEPGWMWTPGYWAYGPDGYYWVPGTWVPAPYVGAYWTPGYWGWSNGLFIWYPGYWGPTVGYYGGVNYGFGFFGVGFVGGVWHGGVFAYNTAVVRVNTTVIRNVYVDRTVIASHTVAVNSHVAFSGGPGGINHPATPAERAAMSQQHLTATPRQMQHETAAKNNMNSYASHNGGHPANLAVARPMGTGARGAVTVNPPDGLNRTSRGNSPGPQPQRTTPKLMNTQPHPGQQPHPAPAGKGPTAQETHSFNYGHAAPQSHPAPKSEGQEHGR